MGSRRQFISGVAAAVIPARVQADERDPVLITAMKALRWSDPDRPACHFRPPANRTNDPNGTIFYKGRHHLFTQLNPFTARIGNQHWGHARTIEIYVDDRIAAIYHPVEADREGQGIAVTAASEGRRGILGVPGGSPRHRRRRASVPGWWFARSVAGVAVKRSQFQP